MNRRGFFQGLAIGAGALAFGGRHVAHAAVDPLSVGMMASTAIGIIQGFSSKPDGLGAMLRAQYEMLNLMVGQLENIQQSLGRIESAIADLPGEVRDIVAEQYGNGLLAQIRGSAGNYRSFLRAYLEDQSVLTSEPVRNQLGLILGSAADRRSTLKELDFGRGPEAAMVLPISMALEIACLSHLRFPTAVIRSRLTDYAEWIDDMMRSDLAGSIPDRRAQAMARHDEILAAAQQAPLGARLNIGKMRFANPEPTTRVESSPCAYLCVIDVQTENGLNAHTTRDIRNTLGPFCPSVYMGSRWVQTEEKAELEAYLLSLERLDMSVTRSSASLGPKAGTRCEILRIPWQDNAAQISATRTYSYVNNRYPYLRDESFPALAAVLAQANLQRANIAVGAHAELLLHHTGRTLREFRQTIGV